MKKQYILTVADCLTDEDMTTGLIDIFLEEYATAVLFAKQSIIKNSEKINSICVTVSFRTAELLWLYKSIEMSQIFMEHEILTDTKFKMNL